MEHALLKPTLHVEVAIKTQLHNVDEAQLRNEIKQWLTTNFVTVQIGHDLSSAKGMSRCVQRKSFGGSRELDEPTLEGLVDLVEIADYTGPPALAGDCHNLHSLVLDIQCYSLKSEPDTDARRKITQSEEDHSSRARIIPLPNTALKHEWSSLVFDDALPARLLRYLTRMVGMMRQPGLNLSAFNWNRLCLLHGPPGSGKSTLCRALAQKLSIRLGDVFQRSTLVEINTNAMLSKFFGESGKLIGAMFDHIHTQAQDPNVLICVVMDEVETIAGSRERSASGTECGDGMRATNQLLTALDRLRGLPNIIVLCTSNLIGAIDRAFLDRVDIKQLIPSPSPAAIYNIFRSCLNELVRSSLVDVTAQQTAHPTATTTRSAATPTAGTNGPSTSTKRATRSKTRASPSSPEQWTLLSAPEMPTFSEMQVRWVNEPQSPARRVWALAQKCEGFSGRTLRRLPIMGLAMYTWGGDCSLDDAISALEAVVSQELEVKFKSAGM